MIVDNVLRLMTCTLAYFLITAASTTLAQTEGKAGAGAEAPALKPEELEQLVAPIALYADSLVSQVLMAATYPIEVVQAERWVRQNKNLKGDVLATALEKETWDPSVKSLVNFPEVLLMMSERLEWTNKLGDAFLAQPKDVMGAIQALRAKAKQQGNLESNEQQTIVVQQEAQTQVIVIDSPNPEIVYVPTYNPTVVYGAWPYPAYPPYYYYPPGYVATTAAVSFGIGVACGAAWGYAWGDCNWGHGDVDIDVDRNAFVNNKIDRSRYKSEIGSRNRNMQNGRGSWQHDPSHRKGAAYRDSNTAGRFGGTSATDAARARDSYRGRADAGRQDLARGGAAQARGGGAGQAGGRQPAAAASRNQGGGSATANRPQAQNRGAAPTQQRQSAAADRSRSSQGSRGGAFDGAGQGQSARSASSRGQASRAAPSGGGSRGGGMGRGGGGGGGRGGRGPGHDVQIY